MTTMFVSSSDILKAIYWDVGLLKSLIRERNPHGNLDKPFWKQDATVRSSVLVEKTV